MEKLHLGCFLYKWSSVIKEVEWGRGAAQPSVLLESCKRTNTSDTKLDILDKKVKAGLTFFLSNGRSSVWLVAGLVSPPPWGLAIAGAALTWRAQTGHFHLNTFIFWLEDQEVCPYCNRIPGRIHSNRRSSHSCRSRRIHRNHRNLGCRIPGSSSFRSPGSSPGSDRRAPGLPGRRSRRARRRTAAAGTPPWAERSSAHTEEQTDRRSTEKQDSSKQRTCAPANADIPGLLQ